MPTPLSPQVLRDLYADFCQLDPWGGWDREIHKVHQQIQNLSSSALRSRESQERLWKATELGTLAQGGNVGLGSATTDPAVTEALARLRETDWPTEPEERAKQLSKIYNRLLTEVRDLSGKRQRARSRLARAIHALLPAELHAGYSYDSNRAVSELVLGKTTDYLMGHVLVRAKLREILGEERDLAEHAKRGTFCWFLWIHADALRQQGTLTHLLIRSNPESSWEDTHGEDYKFGSTVPNHTKVVEGSYVVLDRKGPGGGRLFASARIRSTRREKATLVNGKSRKNWTATFADYEAFAVERGLTEEEKGELAASPGYNVQHAIRRIPPSLFKKLAATEPPWRLVQTADEAVDAVRNFAAATATEQESVTARQYFAYDTLSGWVAPAKFAGVFGMTIARYQQALDGAAPPRVFDGTRTQEAIRRVSGPINSQYAMEAVAKRFPRHSSEVQVFALGPNPERPPLLPAFLNEIGAMRRFLKEDGQHTLHKPLMLLAGADLTVRGMALTWSNLSRRFDQFTSICKRQELRAIHPFWRLDPRDGSDSAFWRLLDDQGNGAPTVLKSNAAAAPYTAHWLAGRERCFQDRRLRAVVIEAILALVPEPHRDALRAEVGHSHQDMDDMPADGAKPVPIEVERDLGVISAAFSQVVSDSGLQFGERTARFTRSFLASAATKRFVILTGLSGSGKTQIGMKLGDWFGPESSLVIPVRPDWTGAEALFGYEDVLQAEVNGKRPWHVPQALAFMLKANAFPADPHLLVLDEMNLAHVERYFADVLSGMESGRGCLPNLKEIAGRWVRADGVEKIPFPSNLFIVGTVNVDETTYMFSPKVLDRANTIEFRVGIDELSQDPLLDSRPRDGAAGNPSHIRGLLAVARDPNWQANNGPDWIQQFTQQFRQLHGILQPHGFEFGHRVYSEAARFACIHAQMGGGSYEEALDLQVMQKVLPRLHGARRRLEPVLCAVARFAFDNSEEEKDAFDPVKVDAKIARLPISFDKLLRMTRMVRANQFASFAE